MSTITSPSTARRVARRSSGPLVAPAAGRRTYDRAMPRYARAEREALADLLLALGPDAPTINEGWADP